MQCEFNPFNAAFSLHYCKFGYQNCKGRCNLAFTFVCRTERGKDKWKGSGYGYGKNAKNVIEGKGRTEKGE